MALQGLRPSIERACGLLWHEGPAPGCVAGINKTWAVGVPNYCCRSTTILVLLMHTAALLCIPPLLLLLQYYYMYYYYEIGMYSVAPTTFTSFYNPPHEVRLGGRLLRMSFQPT